jgi:hypothetical protein
MVWSRFRRLSTQSHNRAPVFMPRKCFFENGRKKSRKPVIAPGPQYGSASLSITTEVNCGRGKAPGHIISPGAQHSSTAEIASQKVYPSALHTIHLVSCINISVRLVYRDYSAGATVCQYPFPYFLTNYGTLELALDFCIFYPYNVKK